MERRGREERWTHNNFVIEIVLLNSKPMHWHCLVCLASVQGRHVDGRRENLAWGEKTAERAHTFPHSFTFVSSERKVKFLTNELHSYGYS